MLEFKTEPLDYELLLATWCNEFRNHQTQSHSKEQIKDVKLKVNNVIIGQIMVTK